ncbi:thaumatin-like protein 1b [Iris pallida]|uniref:Thaumatin-like protein 1b n=1 Tax=Iris pallida TaxID=29817 RepID=A0AAX6DKH4_IRIPA|nr:thaumatin-like protein 1b [Iris pallida]
MSKYSRSNFNYLYLQEQLPLHSVARHTPGRLILPAVPNRIRAR